MLTSIAIIILLGLGAGALTSRVKLPYIIGMLFAGIIIGPYGFNLVDASMLEISAALRKIALIIILLKAGLSLDFSDLKKIGRPAILLCFLPASFEIVAFLLFGPTLLHISFIEAGIIGAVMGAVSPAIIVPRMTRMMEEKVGTKKGIPQMIIAGSSADDVYVIVLFTALLSIEQGGKVGIGDFMQIPVSILLGIVIGIIVGYLMTFIFLKFHMRDTIKVLVLISSSLLLVSMEDALSGILPVSGLLAVMSMGVTINCKYRVLTERIAGKFSKLWVGAEIFLFVLVGTTVNISYVKSAGITVVSMLFIGLLFRLLGTLVSLIHTPLNQKEKLFCLIAEVPKATVQAAIGGVPLAAGLSCGNLVLTTAVISILITAPLGAFGIDHTYKKLLKE